MNSFSNHRDISGAMILYLYCEKCRDLRYILSQGLELSLRRCVIDDDMDDDLKRIFGYGYEYRFRDLLLDALDLVEGWRSGIDISQVATFQEAFDYACRLIKEDIAAKNAMFEKCYVGIRKELSYIPF